MARLLLLVALATASLAMTPPSSNSIDQLQNKLMLNKDELQKKASELMLLSKTLKFEEATVAGVKGVKVSGIPGESALAKSGLKNDDVIVAINDTQIEKASQSMKLFETIRTEKKFRLKVMRGQKIEWIDVEVK